jgi:hypothetical protein
VTVENLVDLVRNRKPGSCGMTYHPAASVAATSSTVTQPTHLQLRLDDRFHETALLPSLDFGPENAALSGVAYDSNFGNARLEYDVRMAEGR